MRKDGRCFLYLGLLAGGRNWLHDRLRFRLYWLLWPHDMGYLYLRSLCRLCWRRLGLLSTQIYRLQRGMRHCRYNRG